MSIKKEIKCKECGFCCKQIIIPIDNSRISKENIDEISWLISHHNISLIYNEAKLHFEFGLVVLSECKFLNSENKCSIYKNRFDVCRRYNTNACFINSKKYNKNTVKFINDITELVKFLNKYEKELKNAPK